MRPHGVLEELQSACHQLLGICDRRFYVGVAFSFAYRARSSPNEAPRFGVQMVQKVHPQTACRFSPTHAALDARYEQTTLGDALGVLSSRCKNMRMAPVALLRVGSSSFR